MMSTRKSPAKKAFSARVLNCLIVFLLLSVAAQLSFAATSGTYALSVSTQSNHSSAVALNGATLSGNAYVFTSLASSLTNFDPTGISKVCYWLDNAGGAATHCESAMPYDFAGSVSNSASSAGNPWNTSALAAGTHSITQLVTTSAGAMETDTATFTIGFAAAKTAVAIAVSPTSAAVQTGATQPFSATVTGTTTTGVTWLVNGVAGGNATVGTISTSGLYSAPASIPSGGSVTVKAQSIADTTKSATAAVAISAPPASAATYALSISTSSSHSPASALNGATLSGNAYIFTSLASSLTNYDPTGITSVCYWLDNTAMSGSATHCESAMPYDLAGSVSGTASSAGKPWLTTALANGAHTITQSVTKSAGGTETDTAAFTIHNVVTPLALTTSSLPNGGVNQAYSATLTSSGGAAPYTWSIVSGSMGAGLTLSTSGIISGTPTTAGQYSFSVQVKDSEATPQAATVPMILTIATVPPSVATNLLPTATVNAAYSATLAGSGGTAPYSWMITGGALPSGVSLNSVGVIAGTPTVTGTFAATVQLTDATGRTASGNESLTVASTSVPGFQKFYAPTSFWNTPIPANVTVDPNSAAMIAESITPYNGTVGNYNVSFTNTAYGIAMAYASAPDKVYTVACTEYCGPGVSGGVVQFPIPAGALPETGSDHHLAVVYQAQDGSPYAGMELDMWEASYDASNDTWSAKGVATTSVFGWGAECALGQHCFSNNAAGFAGMGGPVRPEEIAQGHIDHALTIGTPYNRTGGYFACPATHHDEIAGSSTALPQGAQIFIPASFNIPAAAAAGHWPSWVVTIANALQKYGAYNRYYSGNLAVYGVANQNAGVPLWSSVGVPLNTADYNNLKVLPWSSMEVVTMTDCSQ